MEYHSEISAVLFKGKPYVRVGKYWQGKHLRGI